MLRALVPLLAAGLIVAAPARADVALRDDVRAADVALAGRDVLVARSGTDGRIGVDALDLDGAPARRVLDVPAPGRGWSADLRIAASPLRVAVLARLEDNEGETRGFRLYTGPPSGPLAIALRVPRPVAATWLPGEVDVADERVLLIEFRRRDLRARARILAPGAEPAAVPWPGRALAPAALAGGYLAFLGSLQRGADAPLDRLFVADAATGAVEATLDIDDPDTLDHEGAGLDLAPDGRLVAASDGRLLTVAPRVAQTVVPGAGVRSSPQFAGAGLVALEAARHGARRPVAIDADGSDRWLGGPSTVVERVVADAQGAAWIANGCVRYAALAGPAPAVAEPHCPGAEVLIEQHGFALRRRSVRLDVTCVAVAGPGCRGKARLRPGGIARRFALPAGARRRVALRLTDTGRRRVRAQLRRYGEAELAVATRLRTGRLSLARGKPSVLLVRDGI